MQRTCKQSPVSVYDIYVYTQKAPLPKNARSYRGRPLLRLPLDPPLLTSSFDFHFIRLVLRVITVSGAMRQNREDLRSLISRANHRITVCIQLSVVFVTGCCLTNTDRLSEICCIFLVVQPDEHNT